MENTYTGTTWNMEITAPLPMTVTCIFLFSENDLYYFSKQNYI